MSFRDHFQTALARVLLGAIVAVALTVIYVRGMWLYSMEQRRTQQRDE